MRQVTIPEPTRRILELLNEARDIADIGRFGRYSDVAGQEMRRAIELARSAAIDHYQQSKPDERDDKANNA